MTRAKSGYVWLNGSLVEWDRAQVHTSAHGLHYGTGVFEGTRLYQTDQGPALFRLESHLNRLFASAGAYEMTIPYSLDDLASATIEVVRTNQLTNAYIRHLSFFDEGGLGIRSKSTVSVVILAWEFTGLHGTAGLENGIRATISPWRKIGRDMLPTTAKAAGQYLNSRLAVSEAANRGFDEAILLNSEGNIAEASVANVFISKNGKLITNDEQSSILLGITRDTAIQIARGLGIPVEIRSFSPDELLGADEAFITGTASEIVPVREVDKHLIGPGRHGGRGEMTTRIQKEFYAVTTGRSQSHPEWLDYVNAHDVEESQGILA
jgi:branched-chain amino acid aminotransferase